jgi:hypothetical protein
VGGGTGESHDYQKSRIDEGQLDDFLKKGNRLEE